MSKVALIVGIAGQDGTLLSELLIKKNYKIYGILRKKIDFQHNPKFVKLIKNKSIKIINSNVFNETSIKANLLKIKPDEVYYLATTHELEPTYTNFQEVMNVNVTGLFKILEVIKNEKINSKIFYAGSSNIFAGSKTYPQNEKTLMAPLSIYGVAKTTAINLINFYKNNYNIFACYGILYNHESSLRKENFVTMKIIKTALMIKSGLKNEIILGEVNDKRDWGCAKDFVKAMWLMLQSEKPDNYVIGTGKVFSVKDLLDITFDYLNLNWEKYLVIDKKFYRKKDETMLVADNSKIKNNLNWVPSRDFKKVVEEIIEEVRDNIKIN